MSECCREAAKVRGRNPAVLRPIENRQAGALLRGITALGTTMKRQLPLTEKLARSRFASLLVSLPLWNERLSEWITIQMNIDR